jgi:hypothetical protein
MTPPGEGGRSEKGEGRKPKNAIFPGQRAPLVRQAEDGEEW